MTRERLLSVSDAELRSIAYSHGIYEEGSEFDREMLIEELVEDLGLLDSENKAIHTSTKRYEFTEEVSYLYEECDEESHSFVFLRRYGQTHLVFIQRDLTWAFVDWEIAPNQMKQFRQMGDYKGIFLRVSCFTQSRTGFHLEDFQDNSLPEEFGRQYVQLMQSEGTFWHQLSLRVEAGGREHQVALSDMLLTSVNGEANDE